MIIVNRRMKQKLEKEQPEDQAANRKGRGTRDMLVCLQIIMEKALSMDQQAFIMFIHIAFCATILVCLDVI